MTAATMRAGVGKPIPGNEPKHVTAKTDVVPYATVGMLLIRFPDPADDEDDDVGSGTLIATEQPALKGRLVLTCAHNVYDRPSGKEALTVSFTPGSNGPHPPFGTVKVKAWRFPSEFKATPGVRHDYALLLLDTPVTLDRYATLASTDQPTGTAQLLGMYGYTDADDSLMYEGKGAITGSAAYEIDYAISTLPGTSGTRLCLADPMTIVGVHVRSADAGDDWNIARRITAEVVDAVKAWEEEFAAL